MFCPKCGANIESYQKFCPKCGALLKPAGDRQKEEKNYTSKGISNSTFVFNKKIVIVVFAIIVLALSIFAGTKIIGNKSSGFSGFLPSKNVTNKDLAGTWLISKDIPGIDLSLQFTSGGNVRLKAEPIIIGGKKINYDVVDNNTLYIGALDMVGIDVYFELEGDKLTIDLSGLMKGIGSAYNIPADIISELSGYTRVTMTKSKE